MGKKIRTAVGITLLFAGVIGFLYPNIREWNTRRTVEQIEEQFQSDGEESQLENDADAESAEAQETDAGSYGELYTQMEQYNERLLADVQTIADAWSYEQKPVGLSALEDGEAVGYIDIPDMDVTLPLYIGASKENLAKGAAVLSGTSMPVGGANTNCVIAGHRGYRGSAYFRRIEDLREGSAVYITNPWETLTYVVTGVSIVYPSDANSIRVVQGKDMVTLVTCHPYMSGGKYRYLVYCERADTTATGDGGQPSAAITAEGQREQQVTTAGEEDDKLMEWEDRIRFVLPVLTLVICGIIILARGSSKSN